MKNKIAVGHKKQKRINLSVSSFKYTLQSTLIIPSYTTILLFIQELVEKYVTKLKKRLLWCGVRIIAT